MPDICVPPPNQCLLNEPDANDEALACLSPPALPSAQPTADFGGTDGAEGGTGVGADELVKRFSDDGAGGAPGTPGALSHQSVSCLKDDFRLVSACTNLVTARGPVGFVAAGFGCASALLAELECQSR